ncbi:hypothetical protein OG21DRAFT_1499796 [Imleria badia]|nr:hypothetical protein OG21DRAFT_1499796 [Imleria badia]
MHGSDLNHIAGTARAPPTHSTTTTPSAATRIAHNTTIPALAGHSDLRPLQDLITAEKTVLTTLQKLRVDLAKAGDALRIWGQGEGDDLGDILTASSTILVHFATSLSTYSSLHHTIRDSMKSVRTREEGLDDLRRRRRRVGASAEAAEKKLNKMNPEHKNLSVQADTLNKLREEMRALDGEIVREEAELGDYKRKCTKDWMGFKFGGLVECCETGVIVGDIGRQIIQSIPEDVTEPGLPRAFYNAHGHVGDLVVEAQRAVSQVTFSGNPSGHVSAAAPISQPPAPTQEPFLPTPSLGSELTLGVATYNPPPGPPPIRRASVDELGVHAPSAQAPQFSSLATNKERDPAPASSSVGPARPLSLSTPYESGVTRTEENQSLMASIADALSQSHRGFTLEEATSLGHAGPDEPVPKYEPLAGDLGWSAQSEPHGPVTNGHVGSPSPTEERERTRRTTRRSTSPPCLPPGAAPAAIRAWDDRMGQGEDGAHSDRPASSSTGVPSQRLTSSSELDGEEQQDGLAYDRDSQSLGEECGVGGHGKHHEEDSSLSESGGEESFDVIRPPIRRSVSTGVASNLGGATSLSRAGSQWRIPRVPPPAVDADAIDIHQPSAHERQSVYSTGAGAREDEEEIRTDESANERARNAAAAREVSRAMDALAFSAVAPPSTASGYATPRAPPPGYGLASQSQGAAPYTRSSSSPQSSVPPSPILPPNPPFANRGRSGASTMMEERHPGHVSSESISGRFPAPVPTLTTSGLGGGGPNSPTALRPISPLYRSPPPEYPRPTPPFSSPLMASSTSSLNGASPGGPRTISAAAFRRQQARSPSATELGPADTSPLTFRKPSGSHSPSLSAEASASRQQGLGSGSRSASPVPAPVPKDAPKAKLSVVNPDPRVSDEDEGGVEFDYVGAYGGGENASAGYGAGRYVSDLERH